MDALRLMCVDDSPSLTAAWERLFNAQSDMTVVATLNRADDLVATALEHKPDVVLLDLTMPGRAPLDAAAELAGALPTTRVLFCTGYTDSETVSRALDAGAWGFVDKGREPDRIMQAIRRVAKGEVVVEVTQF